VNSAADELVDSWSVAITTAAPELRAAGEAYGDRLVRFRVSGLDFDANEELGAETTRLLVRAFGQLGAATP
jgi:hypothetical protein